MSDVKHPSYTFRLNSTVDLIHYLHPDRHQSDQDRAQDEANQHAVLRSTWLPGLLRGENHVLNSDDTFTVYGAKAVYLKNTYTTGANPLLSVVE